ncbi:MAG: PA2169 family four-helix-bundle protein [Pyrinomonadaceae bacterium]
MADANNAISTLNNLIQTCKDGENGFNEAAQGVSSADLKDVFMRYSQQRSQFAGELQEAVSKIGGDPETSGSIAASLHRGWIDIKSVVTGQDEGAILSECERGEDSAVEAYQNALKEALPSEVNSIVERQYTQVKEAHDRIKGLRNMSNSASGS